MRALRRIAKLAVLESKIDNMAASRFILTKGGGLIEKEFLGRNQHPPYSFWQGLETRIVQYGRVHWHVLH